MRIITVSRCDDNVRLALLLLVAQTFLLKRSLALPDDDLSLTNAVSSNKSAFFNRSTVRLNSLLKLFPSTLPLNGSFSLSTKEHYVPQLNKNDVDADSPAKTIDDSNQTGYRLDMIVTKLEPTMSTVASCSLHLNSKKSQNQQFIIQWTLSPSSVHCTAVSSAGGAPISANVTSYTDSLYGNNAYYITFVLLESDQLCAKNFEVCDDRLFLPYKCGPASQISVFEPTNESQHRNSACLQKLEFDSRCCQCDDVCSEAQNDSIFPTSHHFPLENDSPVPTPPPFLINSVPQANLTADLMKNRQEIANLLGDQQSSTKMNISSANLTTIEPTTGRNATDLLPTSAAIQLPSNACDSKPCLNDGLCILNTPTQFGSDDAQSSSFYCRCLGPYFGPRCQFTLDYCENVTCSNGGTCQPLNLTTTNSSVVADRFECQCAPNFEGRFCESLIVAKADPCTPNPCHHNAPCVPIRLGVTSSQRNEAPGTVFPPSQRPTAPATFVDPLNSIGAFPLTNRDTQADSGISHLINPPVDSHGVAPPRLFRCDCPEEWAGDDLCATPSRTTHSPTLTTSPSSGTSSVVTTPSLPDCRVAHSMVCGSGQCDQLNGRCNCAGTGFTGQFCDEDIDECKLKPCKNNATCLNLIGSFNCTCRPGFTGSLCSTPMTGWASGQSKSSGPNVGAIVGGVLGGLALIALLIGAYFSYRYVSRSRKLKGKYNPAREEMSNVGGHPVPMTTLSTGERLI